MQRHPIGALLHQHADAVGAGKRRKMLRHSDANAVEVQRAAKRLSERHQPLELFGPTLRFLGCQFRGHGLRLLLMVAADLVENKRANQQHQRRQQSQAGLQLDLADIVEHPRNRG